MAFFPSVVLNGAKGMVSQPRVKSQVKSLPLTWDFGFLNFSEPQFLRVQNGHGPTYDIRTSVHIKDTVYKLPDVIDVR